MEVAPRVKNPTRKFSLTRDDLPKYARFDRIKIAFLGLNQITRMFCMFSSIALRNVSCVCEGEGGKGAVAVRGME